jgi:hypothetical protein
MTTQTIPRWKIAAPAGGKIELKIGTREGRFRVLEMTIYFDYVSDDESQERNFEFTLRIPMTSKNSLKSEMYWEYVASVKMEEMGIHIASKHWDEGVVGYRYTGRTNAYKPRYVVINKKTKWCNPSKGGWGVLHEPDYTRFGL